jgi:hypothetical protein
MKGLQVKANLEKDEKAKDDIEYSLNNRVLRFFIYFIKYEDSSISKFIALLNEELHNQNYIDK